MPGFTRRGVMGAAAAGLTVAAIGRGASAQQGAPGQITVVSGPAGSGWNAIGAALAALYARQGVRANAEPGGAMTNIIQAHEKKAEVAMTMGVAIGMALQGEAPFRSRIATMRGLALFGDQTGHFLVRADSNINRWEDLRGKPYASQAPGNASQVAFADALKAHGMTEADVRISRGSQQFGGDGTKDRRFVGVTAMTGYPGPMFMDVMRSVPSRLLSLSEESLQKVLSYNPGWARRTIPANTYPGQSEPVLTFGTPAQFVVHQDMPEAQVYWLTRVLHENLEAFKRTQAALNDMNNETMPRVVGVELHPGAARYYREKGMVR